MSPERRIVSPISFTFFGCFDGDFCLALFLLEPHKIPMAKYETSEGEKKNDSFEMQERKFQKPRNARRSHNQPEPWPFLKNFSDQRALSTTTLVTSPAEHASLFEARVTWDGGICRLRLGHHRKKKSGIHFAVPSRAKAANARNKERISEDL